MSILPENTAAIHISKLLDAANESGLPVWREITADQARKFILSYVQLADVLQADYQTIHDSYMAKPNNKRWGPWYIGQILLDKQKQSYRERLELDRKACAKSPIKPKMMSTEQQQDQRRAGEMKAKASRAEQLEMVRWAQRQTGRTSIGIYAAYLTRAKYEREAGEK